MTARADVLIVGGGIIGCALARELAGRGRRVTVVERGELGGEASGAAAGLLSPQAEALERGPLFDLSLASRDLYEEWARGLEQETGTQVGYRKSGALRCALSEEEQRRLAACRAWQQEALLPVEPLDRALIARDWRGAISPEVREALFFPREAIVHCPWLMAALARSLQLRGVVVKRRTSVLRFRIDSGVCAGVETDSGPLDAENVVDAAGAWAGSDLGLPFVLPVRPVRGQIVALVSEDPVSTVVQSEEVYVVPRADGRVLLGATVEEAGFRKEVTAEGVERLLAAARRLLPGLAAARFDRAWAGLRPGTPDGQPFLGDCGVRGLHLAAGHFRSGILLAPLTARMLADRITGVSSVELRRFSIRRLGDPSPFGDRRVSPSAAKRRDPAPTGDFR